MAIEQANLGRSQANLLNCSVVSAHVDALADLEGLVE